MSSRKAADAGPWAEAVRRSTAATTAARPGGMDENCWDDVAMRNIIAIVLYALHMRDGQPVESIAWNAVLWQLRDDRRVDVLVNRVLPGAGHDLARTAAPGDPVAETWRWLTRTWDPNAPTRGFSTVFLGQPHRAETGWVPDAPELRWGGMSRGIGSGLPDPALVRNSSGISRPSLSHQRGAPGPGCGRRTGSLGVSEIAGKRYSLETWRLAA